MTGAAVQYSQKAGAVRTAFARMARRLSIRVRAGGVTLPALLACVLLPAGAWAFGYVLAGLLLDLGLIGGRG